MQERKQTRRWSGVLLALLLSCVSGWCEPTAPVPVDSATTNMVIADPAWLTSPSADSPLAPSPQIGRPVWALVSVLGLLCGAHFLLRRRVSAWVCPAPDRLKIITRQRLGARQELLVVEWEGERLLLGVGPAFINPIHRKPASEPTPFPVTGEGVSS
ncbi:MAG TPA: hypothetical protein DCS43_11370 [Verrucomicrobia bacterium]|nr:hypothetical protein [Verrucomicrobiota bacterium]